MWSLDQQHLAELLEMWDLRPHESESAALEEYQACYYIDDAREPVFSAFFEDQAEVKREHGKQFLKYLIGLGNTICLPVIKRPEVDNWQTGIKALEYALELEKQLSHLLIDLKITAIANNDSHLLNFMKRFMDKQRKDINHLQCHIVYYKILEREVQKQEELLKKAAEKKPVG